MPKLKEIRCEVCGEPVNVLLDYADAISGKLLSPREYLEHQLAMTDEEKAQRQVFFEELFATHNARKAE